MSSKPINYNKPCRQVYIDMARSHPKLCIWRNDLDGLRGGNMNLPSWVPAGDAAFVRYITSLYLITTGTRSTAIVLAACSITKRDMRLSPAFGQTVISVGDGKEFQPYVSLAA